MSLLGQPRPCTSCKAMIYDADPMVSGQKKMPVDAEPDPNGNIELEVSWAAIRYRVLSKAEATSPPLFGERKLHKSHFATCPYSNRYRS